MILQGSIHLHRGEISVRAYSYLTPNAFSPKCIKFTNDTASESTAHHSSAEVDMSVPNEMKVPKTNTAIKTIADKRETENARNQDMERSVDLSSSEYVYQPQEKQMGSDSREITNVNEQKSLCNANISNLAFPLVDTLI